MGLFHFLVIVQGAIAFALVVSILMQRSEGGGLGVGGSPSGLMSARGAADFMTRTTTVLAVLFVGLSVGLAFVAAKQGSGGTIDDSFQRTQVEQQTTGEVTAENPIAPVGVNNDPLAAAAAAASESDNKDTESSKDTKE